MLLLRTRQKIALARMIARPLRQARRLLGAGDWVEVRRRGVRWRLDLGEGIDLAIYLFGAFEIRTVKAYERVVAPGHQVLDVGANIGAHALPLAQRVGAGGRVVCFEPTAFAFAKLKRNLELNAELARRVFAEQLMLSASRQGPLEPSLFASWPLDDDPALHPVHGGRERSTDGARSATLDDYLAGNKIGRIDFVKLDVDGFECDVLAGAAETLRTWRPVMLVELAPEALRERGRQLGDFLGVLVSHDYRLESLASRRRLPMHESELRRHVPPGGSINAFAFPGPGAHRPR